MARFLPDPPSRTGGILTKRELDAALRVLSTLRQPQPATVVLSWDNDMQDILQGLGRARYVETLPAYGERSPKPSAPFRHDVMKTTPRGLEYLESIQTAKNVPPARQHATKRSRAQLDHEIATVLARQPAKSTAHSSRQHSTRRGGAASPQQEFDCYWEIDGHEYYWPVKAKDAISAAQTFAAEYDVTDIPDDSSAVCVVVPQRGEGRGPSGPPKRFRAYTKGKLRVEPLATNDPRSVNREKSFQTPQQRKARAKKLKAKG